MIWREGECTVVAVHKNPMAKITISTPAGPFITGMPDIAQMFLRHPGSFGHRFGEALDGALGEVRVQEIVQHIEQAVACVNGHREEIATGIRGVCVHVEPMFHSDCWRPR